MTFCTKNCIGPKPLHIVFNKEDGSIEDYSGTKYLVLFVFKNIMPFSVGLDIL